MSSGQGRLRTELANRSGPHWSLILKNNIYSLGFLFSALVTLGAAIVATPPANLSWQVFFEDPASLAVKAWFLVSTYLWPAILSFTAIVGLQLQFRLSSGGSGKCTVFSVCLVASLAMLVGLQRLSMSPSSAPAYALGMALGYMAMSRLYAVRVRRVWPGVAIPHIIWRGNSEAVRQMDRLAAQIREGSAKAADPAGTGGGKLK